jgi:hypothetical protein
MNESTTSILVVLANPRGTDTLNLDDEEKVIRAATNEGVESGRIRLDIVYSATLDELKDALWKDEYHIVHISAHGTVDYGLLVLEDENRAPSFVDEETLGKLLQASASVECVVLNACNMYHQAQRTVIGIPYTVFNYREVLDEKAIAFTEGFYAAIGRGENIENAYKSGCRCLDNQSTDDHPYLFVSMTEETRAHTRDYDWKYNEGFDYTRLK